MNRFILDNDAWDIPALMCDQHIVKMVTEEAQMLCHAIRYHMPRYASTNGNDDALFQPMSAGHAKHPCTQWLLYSRSNFDWAVDLFHFMCVEYTSRFHKTHGTEDRVGSAIYLAMTHNDYEDWPDVGLSSHPQCFGDMQQQCETDEWWPVNAYRAYYRTKLTTFSRPMRFKHGVPTFMQTQEDAA